MAGGGLVLIHLYYTARVPFFKCEDTEGTGYLALVLNDPTPTPHNYLPKLFLSISSGIDLDELETIISATTILPQSL